MLDPHLLLAFLAAMTLVATFALLVLPRDAGRGPWRVAIHPAWLSPMVVFVPYVVGCYAQGALPPWPPEAYGLQAAVHGVWAGVAMALCVGVTDLWLLVGAARVVSRFAPPEDAAMTRWCYAANLVAGGLFILWALARRKGLV